MGFSNVILMLMGLVMVFAAVSNAGRQCLSMTNETVRVMQFSSCETCITQPKVKENATEIVGPQVVMIVMSEVEQTEFMLTVAARLIQARLKVVLVYDENGPDLSRLKERIEDSVSCDTIPLLTSLLSFQPTNQAIHSQSVRLESPYDALDRAEWGYQSLETVLDNVDHPPDVIVLHAVNVGGALLVEQRETPTVIIAPPALLPLFTKQQSLSLMEFVQRRISSFSLAVRFIQLNKLRQSFGLPFLRTPSDYFGKAMAVLVNELPELATRRFVLPSNAYLVGPLLPPCVSCNRDEKRTAGNDNATTILVLDTALDLKETRKLLRGLALTRTELKFFVQTTCHADSHSLELFNEACDAADTLSDFQVVWQGGNHSALPALLPSFLVLENSLSALELVAKYSNTAAVISQCDSESYPFAAIGEVVVCVPTSFGNVEFTRLLGTRLGANVADLQSKSIARSLLKALVKPRTDFDWQEKLVDGGSLTAHIIQTVASASCHGDPNRVRKLVHERICGTTDRAEDRELVVATFIGWSIILTILILYFLRQQNRQVWDEGFFRHLQELDVAWYYYLRWRSNQDSLHNQINALLSQLEPEKAMEEKHPEKNHRRRRTTKKR